MTTSGAIVSPDLEALRTAVTGGVFVPGEDGYDQARQAWNLAVDERPAVVVMAESAADGQDVTVPAAEHGLAALAGTSPNVGVTGYTLGGGIGWLARRYGLAANSVTAAEVVTPDGRLARTDADHEPDLYHPAGRCAPAHLRRAPALHLRR
jgi:hypothetical protein